MTISFNFLLLLLTKILLYNKCQNSYNRILIFILSLKHLKKYTAKHSKNKSIPLVYNSLNDNNKTIFECIQLYDEHFLTITKLQKLMQKQLLLKYGYFLPFNLYISLYSNSCFTIRTDIVYTSLPCIWKRKNKLLGC